MICSSGERLILFGRRALIVVNKLVIAQPWAKAEK